MRLAQLRWLRFLVVGGCGFLIDSGVLTVLNEHMQWRLLPARLVSFASASFVTWLMNRMLVFGDRRHSSPHAAHSSRDEYLRYMAVQFVGAATNLLVFFLVCWARPDWARHVVLPLAMGAIVSAGVTYMLLNSWLYRQRTQGPT